MSLKHLHDQITGYVMECPVSLPCGHTFDATTAIRITQCPLDRILFEHRNLKTNFSIKDGLDEARKKIQKPQTSRKIQLYFHEFKLRFVQSGSVAATFSAKEWKQAEATFAWMFKNLPAQHQGSLKTTNVIIGDLEWSSNDASYVYTVTSVNYDQEEISTLFRLQIKENWAQNFAGKYFDSLKSKNVAKNQ